MYKHCKVETDGRVQTVTIQRPEVMNALDPETNFELAEVFDRFDADPDLWVAILTGSGDKAFCAGLDIKSQTPGASLSEDPDSGFGGLTARFQSSKPIIAAINGGAVGGGFEIALACDLIVAADHANFALPEAHIGLAPMAGGMHRLTRQIGLKQAMGMLLTGRRMSAQEALNQGLVNEVVPAGELMECANRWAKNILKCAPLSTRAIKQCVLEGMRHGSLENAMGAHYSALDDMLRSNDLAEGMRAFIEKRRPNWKGQ
ncbi:MAG: enoyl-CoA hydratase/carnithine racemase [Planctomycetota bacterium]|jgi:enoyl-CoA hydratase/carnithine racemase